MSWTWQLEKEDGTVLVSRGLPKETFSSQGDAESWIGENWRAPLDAGGDQGTLLGEGRAQGGPGGLPPAGKGTPGCPGANSLPGGARRAGQVLAGDPPVRDRRPHHRADPPLPTERYPLGLDAPPDHVVRGLVRDDFVEPHLPGDADRGGDLVGPPLGDADVEHLALADQVVEGAERLLQRRLVVVAVRLVEVQVVGLQPPERVMSRLDDVLAGQAAVIRAPADRPVGLGEDLERLAAHSVQGPAEH